MCASVTQCGSLLFDVSHCVRAKLLPATAERKTVRDPYLDFSVFSTDLALRAHTQLRLFMLQDIKEICCVIFN